MSANSSVSSASPGNYAELQHFSYFPLLAVLVWTGNTIVTKAASVVIQPASIAFYRWVLAFLILTPFVFTSVWRQRQVVKQHWLKLAILGSLGMAIYQGVAYKAAQSTSAINMGIIVALMPLFSSLLSGLVAGQSPSRKNLSGALLSFAGLVWLSTHGQPAELFGGALHMGDALMLCAVLSNAFYGVLLRRWAVPLTTWQQLYVQAGFGMLVLLPYWLSNPISAITAANLPLVLYAAIPASIAAPYCWIRGVKAVGAPRASMFLNLLPVFVALFAWGLLGEHLHAYHLVGGVMALAGVWWGQRK